MAEIKQYAPFLAVVAPQDDGNYIRHLDGDAQVLVRKNNDPWWEIYIPDAGSIESAVSIAETLNEEARKKFEREIKQERENEDRW